MCSTCILFLCIKTAKSWKTARSSSHVQLSFAGLHSGGRLLRSPMHAGVTLGAKRNLLFISSVTSISGPAELLLLVCFQTRWSGVDGLASIWIFLPAACFFAIISLAVSSPFHTHGASACGLMPPSTPAHFGRRRAPKRPPGLCPFLSARLGSREHTILQMQQKRKL